MGRQAHAHHQQWLRRVDTKSERSNGHATLATARGGGHDGRRAQRVRADDGTYIGCQASNVEFEAGNLTRKEATIIIQSVRALDAIKRYIDQHCSE